MAKGGRRTDPGLRVGEEQLFWSSGAMETPTRQDRVNGNGACSTSACCSRARSTLGRISTEYSELGAGSSYSTRRRDASPGWQQVSGTGWQLGLRVLEGLIKTGQSRSLAKDVPCIPPSYDRQPERTAAGVQQEYPCPGEAPSLFNCVLQRCLLVSWANSLKPRNIAVHAMKRLFFWTDVGSHYAIIPSRPSRWQ
ncbi:uncharacterized protein [Drosophila pseudoobscura]|uniref:Uncharacterized protein n=1 Tax=Drosophila pseudoobscura pseudoobscura TaxID=46245 RepID=A0A6I8VNV2_DROPS|nr:uncharacterized protein LOC117183258 [Drosophila pseudoobscura]